MTHLILVVDDDQLMRMQLRELLSAVGYEVAEASNGEEALSVFTRLHPDMVLLDAMMPVMDGLDCCARLQTLPGGENTPVLMITALYDPELVDRAFALGACDFITKPIHWPILRQRVKRVLRTSQLVQELRSQTQQAQSQEELLRIALSAARMGVWNWDIIKNQITWSESKEYLFGLEKSSFDGKFETFINFVHPEDREKVQQAVIQAIENDAEYDVEFRIVLADGSLRWMVSKGDVFRDDSGIELRMTGVDIDITKRKQMEEALKESEQRWQLCVAGTNDGIWDRNVVTNEVFFSKRWKEMLGFEEQEIANHLNEWSSRVHPDDIERVMQLIQDHFQRKTPFYISEHRVQCKDGSYKWILDRGQALWDESGNVVRMAGSHTDITERKQTEEQLRLSEERFHMVARATNDAVWDWDLLTDTLWWNETLETLFGYSREQVQASPTWRSKHIHPDDKQRVIADISRVINSGGVVWTNEYRFRRADSTYAYILDRGYVVRNAQGEPVRMIGAMMDISERKRVQEELQRQNRRWQLFADVTLKIRQSLQIDEILQTSVTEVHKLLHSDRVIIYKLLPDGSGTVVKEAVTEGIPGIFGEKIYDPCFAEDFIEKYRQGRINAIGDVQTANLQQCYAEFLQQLGVKANLVVPIIRSNQLWGLLIAHQCIRPRYWSEWETELLRQLADQIGIALAQAKMLEQETRQRQELSRSNEELQQFAFIASHDLQEPLRKIKAFGDRLRITYGDVLNEQGRDYLQRMQNAASRMQTLIEDLLTLSRVTTRGQPFEPVNLSLITQEVLSDLEVRIGQVGARIEVGQLLTIDADPIQMRQLLQNLIGNALKFYRKDVPLVVKIYCQFLSNPSNKLLGVQELCAIYVEDNGIGFDEKYLDRIFNVFQRLHGRNEYEGTGMGLAICRKIVERHRGDITAQSKPGSGATFIVTLPINAHS